MTAQVFFPRYFANRYGFAGDTLLIRVVSATQSERITMDGYSQRLDEHFTLAFALNAVREEKWIEVLQANAEAMLAAQQN